VEHCNNNTLLGQSLQIPISDPSIESLHVLLEPSREDLSNEGKRRGGCRVMGRQWGIAFKELL